MHLVTTVILIADEGEEKAIQWINRAWRSGDPFAPVHSHDSSTIAGTKALERTICIGAFNYLDEARLIAAVKAAPWRAPEYVELLVCEQDDTRFESVELEIARR